MKSLIACACLALVTTPAFAQQATVAGRTTISPARPVAEAVPVARPPRADGGDRQAYADALNKAYRRAHNAVKNGASPERVRAKLQAYKQHLRERWNATH